MLVYLLPYDPDTGRPVRFDLHVEPRGPEPETIGETSRGSVDSHIVRDERKGRYAVGGGNRLADLQLVRKEKSVTYRGIIENYRFNPIPLKNEKERELFKSIESYHYSTDEINEKTQE